MAEKASVTFEVLNIQTGTEMAGAIVQLREYYAMDKLPQPPLLNNVVQLAPCDLRVTETRGANGLKTGKIVITGPSGDTLFEQEWLLSPGSS